MRSRTQPLRLDGSFQHDSTDHDDDLRRQRQADRHAPNGKTIRKQNQTSRYPQF